MTNPSDQLRRSFPPCQGGTEGGPGVGRDLPRPLLVKEGSSKGARPAFSLLELMIGIMVLGLGMVMVATMFPVAWHRARELNEYTIQKAAAAGAHDTVKSLVRVAGPFEPSSFAGDLILDPVLHAYDGRVQTVAKSLLGTAGAWRCADTRVHALNLENILVQSRAFVDEDPWVIEKALALNEIDGLAPEEVDREFLWYSYVKAQVRFGQRVYPPLTQDRQNVNLVTGEFEGNDAQWDGALDSVRFCWAVFHRLRPIPAADNAATCNGFCWEPARTLWGNPTCGTDGVFDAPSISDFERSVDLYYVTLRRSQSTYRFARQDPESAPNPYNLGPVPTVVPIPRPPEDDLMFPVPWRVQVQFPSSLKVKEYDPAVSPPEFAPTGVPTEIQVPPAEVRGTTRRVMMIQMFPRGAWFIDEITGAVYKVVRRRITGANGDQAFLTLDREVFLEDLDLAKGTSKYMPCPTCNPLDPTDPVADAEELLRTVWVFPPPVQATRIDAQDGPVLVFEGSPPVVEIEQRTLKLAPGE